jgi:hypothetical protein
MKTSSHKHIVHHFAAAVTGQNHSFQWVERVMHSIGRMGRTKDAGAR